MMEDVLNALLSIDDDNERYEAALELARSVEFAAEWAKVWIERPDDRSREVARIILARVCPQETSDPSEEPNAIIDGSVKSLENGNNS